MIYRRLTCSEALHGNLMKNASHDRPDCYTFAMGPSAGAVAVNLTRLEWEPGQVARRKELLQVLAGSAASR